MLSDNIQPHNADYMDDVENRTAEIEWGTNRIARARFNGDKQNDTIEI